MADKKRHFLGLSHNPFAHPGSDFYPFGNRQSLLDQLRHLSRWTRRLLVVSAELGGGKTTLYRNLSANMDARAKAARINGTLVSSARDVMVGIAQGFGIAIPTDATSKLLNDLIDSHVIELSAQKRISVVLIDDAHLLDVRAVDQLLSIIAKNDLRVVFFTEPAFINNLANAIERVDNQIEWQEMPLPRYSLEEVRSYMERKFQEAAYRGHLPFTEQQVANIAGVTNGNPGKINEAANDQLLLMESGELIKKRQSFPPLHRAIAMLLVVFLGVVYFSFNPAENPSDGVPAITSLAVSANPIDVDSEDLELEEPVDVEIDPGADSGFEADAEEEPHPVPEREVEPTTVLEQEIEPVVVVESTESESELVVPPTVSEPASVQETVTEIVAAPVVQVPVTQEPMPQDSADETPPTVEVAQTRVSAEFGNAEWLLAQPASNYTMQLLSSGSVDGVRDYIARQAEPRLFSSYQAQVNGRTVYVVLYGMFVDKAAAEAASTQLPTEVGNVSPWIRTLTGVQKVIRDFKAR